MAEAMIGSACANVKIVAEQSLEDHIRTGSTFEVTKITLEIDGQQKQVVLKVVGDDLESGLFPASGNQNHPHYWRREPYAYGSEDVRKALPRGNFRTPDIYAISAGSAVHPSTGKVHASIGMWMEFIKGTRGTEWQPEQFVECARRIGLWQARFIENPRLIPQHEWLLDEKYLMEQHFPGFAQPEGPYDPLKWRKQVALNGYDQKTITEAAFVWSQRERLAQYALAGVPVFCLGDIHHRNVILADNDEMVAFDLTSAGRHVLGEELVPLAESIAIADVEDNIDHYQYALHLLDQYIDVLRKEIGRKLTPDIELRARNAFAARIAIAAHWIGRMCDPVYANVPAGTKEFQFRGARLGTRFGMALLAE